MQQQDRVSPSIRDVTRAELDDLIARAEFDVADRDARVATNARLLADVAVERGRNALRVGGLGLGALAVGALVFRRPLWTMRQQLRRHLPRRRKPEGMTAVHIDEAPPRSIAILTTLIPLAWPFVPPNVRGRVSARTASVIAGIALPFLLGGRRKKAYVQVVPEEAYRRAAPPR